MMKTIFLIIACMFFFVLGFLVDGMITKVPREALAQSEIVRMERAIRNFHAAKKRLPISLDEIANSNGFSKTNVYGYAIEYTRINKFEVWLRSAGYGGESADVKNYYGKQFDVRSE